MTEPEEQPSREEAIYSLVRTFLERYGFAIALVAPFVLLWLVPMGTGGVLVVLVIYLVEVIAYVGIQRRRRGIPSGGGARSGPAAGLQALWGVLAAVLIIGGLFGLWAAGGSPPIVPIIALTLGIAIIAMVWHRVSRSSGEDTSASRLGWSERSAGPAPRRPGRFWCG